jgi:hypothetical protein
MLGDIRKLIHDAWEFFAPPMLRVAVVALFFWYVCGPVPLVNLLQFIEGQASLVAGTNAQGLLEKYNLTALLPVAALFVVSLLAYSANRIVFGVAALLPVRLSSGSILERKAFDDSRWRAHMEWHPRAGIHNMVESALAKARHDKEEYLLKTVDYYQREVGRIFQLFTFAQFLLMWTVACAVLSVTVQGAMHFTYGRVFLLLAGVIFFGVYSACAYADATEHLAGSQLYAALALLERDETKQGKGQATKTVDAERHSEDRSREWAERGNYYRSQPWWWIGLGLMDWWRMLRFFRYREPMYWSPEKGFWVHVLLKNTTNTVWFIIGAMSIRMMAGISWWAACAFFVVYVSVTITDFLLMFFSLIAIVISSAASRISKYIPEEFRQLLDSAKTDQDRARTERRVFTAPRETEWLIYATTAFRVLEVVIAVVMGRALAVYLF